MTSASELRNLVDRILRLKGEQDELTSDIKDIYHEANSAGFNKTALGQVVSILRKRTKHGEKFTAQSELVETYLAALDGEPQTEARARPHAHETTAPAFVSTSVIAGDIVNRPAPVEMPDIPAYLDRRTWVQA